MRHDSKAASTSRSLRRRRRSCPQISALRIGNRSRFSSIGSVTSGVRKKMPASRPRRVTITDPSSAITWLPGHEVTGAADSHVVTPGAYTFRALHRLHGPGEGCRDARISVIFVADASASQRDFDTRGHGPGGSRSPDPPCADFGASRELTTSPYRDRVCAESSWHRALRPGCPWRTLSHRSADRGRPR